MAKKKKNLADELIHLKEDENSELSMNTDEFALELPETELISPDSPEDKNPETQNTLRLVMPEVPAQPSVKSKKKDEVKVSYGLPSSQQVPRPADVGVGQHLKQSEHLRIAQNKMNDLEEEILRLRRENEDLATAGETFKKLNDEYYGTIDSLKAKLNDHKISSNQEIALLRKISQGKEKEILELKQQIEDYKSKVDNNFQRVRKREKDLEHRLEIAKIEEAAVLKSKDQLILDLKRRIDELGLESDNFRKKSQENYQDLQKKQQVVRGAIRALRIALTKLEGEDDSDFGLDALAGKQTDED